MPFFLHQWTYKDKQVWAMVKEGQDRAEIVKIAIETFGGKLHQFFYCFGKYDGIAICEFPDHKTALACVMAIYGQGRNNDVDTTVLITPEEGLDAMRLARYEAVGHGADGGG